jgi:hypothetical protein
MSISGVNLGAASLNNPIAINWQDHVKQRVTDFKSLTDAMNSGNLAGAQSAYTALQNDATFGGQDPTAQLFGPNDQLNSDFKSLGDALSSGNMDDAKKAFAKLQQDMQAARNAQQAKRGHHHHKPAVTVTVSETVTISATAAVVPTDSSNDNDGPNADAGSSGVSGVLNVSA